MYSAIKEIFAVSDLKVPKDDLTATQPQEAASAEQENISITTTEKSPHHEESTLPSNKVTSSQEEVVPLVPQGVLSEEHTLVPTAEAAPAVTEEPTSPPVEETAPAVTEEPTSPPVEEAAAVSARKAAAVPAEYMTPEGTAPFGEKQVETIAAFQTPERSVRAGFLICFALAMVAIWMSIFPSLQILLPQQVAAIDLANKGWLYGLIAALGSVAVLIAYPFVGALSDRTTSPIGRRRPWIIGGVLGAAVMLAVLANAHNTLVLTLGWVLFNACIYGAQIALATIIPDKVPVGQRAFISALIGITAPIGIILGSIIVGGVFRGAPSAYYALMIILLIFNGLFLLVFRNDQHLPKGVVPPLHIGQFLAGFWINPARYPDFAWAWLTRALIILGYATGLAYLLYFFQDVIHYEAIFHRAAAQGVTTFQSTDGIALIIFSIVAGYLSDRLKRRKIFVIIAGACIALGLLLLAFVSSWSLLVLVAAAILGVGFGIYGASDIALITQVLPSARTRGKDMGVLFLASSLPQALAPVIAALSISVSHNYHLLFIIAAISALLGAVLIPRIKSVR